MGQRLVSGDRVVKARRQLSGPGHPRTLRLRCLPLAPGVGGDNPDLAD